MRRRHVAPSPIAECFPNAAESELHTFERLTTLITVGPDTVLMRQGAFGNEALIVLQGEVLVERDGVPVAVVSAGSALGEHALLANEPRNATVRTATDAVVAVMSRAEFASVLDTCPTIGRIVVDQDSART